MERLLALAEKLGKLIAETERYQALKSAEAAMKADASAGESLKALREIEEIIAGKERDLRPVEVDEKRRLAGLRAQVHSSETLQRLAKAQADYLEMMNRVNQTIRQALEGE